MRNKIEKIIFGDIRGLDHNSFCEKCRKIRAYRDPIIDKILSLFLKEYEKRKPKEMEYDKLEKCSLCGSIQYSCTCSDAFNLAITKFDEVIYKMLKTK